MCRRGHGGILGLQIVTVLVNLELRSPIPLLVPLWVHFLTASARLSGCLTPRRVWFELWTAIISQTKWKL